MNIKSIIDQNNTIAGRNFTLFMQLLIILSIVTFSIETIPDLTNSTRELLRSTETIIVIIFTLEYVLRLYVTDKKLNYIFSFYGIIDLAAIVPFYISSGIDLRSLRIFRILRLFRLMKLVRYNGAIRRLSRAFLIAREEIVLFCIVTTMLFYLSAVGIYYFENDAQPEAFKSIFHSLWWAVATLT